MNWVERLATTLPGRPPRAAALAVLAVVLCTTPAVAGPPVSGAMQNFTVHAEPKPAPEIAFEDVDGNRLTLADFAGQVVLLNFWATWCGPCRIEMPDLDQLQAQLGGDDFHVLALSGDRAGMKAIVPFFDEIGIRHLTPYVDKTMASHRAFQARALPTTVLLDGRGREVGRLIGAAKWDSEEAMALMRWYIERTGKPADGTKVTLRD